MSFKLFQGPRKLQIIFQKNVDYILSGGVIPTLLGCTRACRTFVQREAGTFSEENWIL